MLGRPCLTLRDRTERPVTVSAGTNQVVGTESGKIVAEVLGLIETPPSAVGVPELWDGSAGTRIVTELARALESNIVGRTEA
jgi:UDP-N-acetylglucosamine 2-epimerase (non-hydrolysing)